MGRSGQSLDGPWDERLTCQVSILCIQRLDLLYEPARHAHRLKVPSCQQPLLGHQRTVRPRKLTSDCKNKQTCTEAASRTVITSQTGCVSLDLRVGGAGKLSVAQLSNMNLTHEGLIPTQPPACPNQHFFFLLLHPPPIFPLSRCLWSQIMINLPKERTAEQKMDFSIATITIIYCIQLSISRKHILAGLCLNECSQEEGELQLNLLHSWLTNQRFSNIQRLGSYKSKPKLSWVTLRRIDSHLLPPPVYELIAL